MGLNSDYITARGNILMMKPLPFVAIAYGMIIHEEKQRERSSHHLNYSEHAFLNANASSFNKPKYKDKRIHICDHCTKKGHTTNKGYRTIGFPKDFKFNKGKRIAANIMSEGDSEVINNEHRNPSSFPRELCQQFIHFISTYLGDKPHIAAGSGSSSRAFSTHMAHTGVVDSGSSFQDFSTHKAGTKQL